MAFKFVAVVLFMCIFGANAGRIDLKNCDSSAPIQIKEINLRGDKLVLKPGSRISAYGSYTNRYQSHSNTMFKVNIVKLQRKVGWTYFSIKSFLPTSSFDVRCGDIQKLSPIPLCPGLQGNQRFDETVKIPSSLNIPIPSFLASGKYKVSLDIRDGSGRRVVCVKDAVASVSL